MTDSFVATRRVSILWTLFPVQGKIKLVEEGVKASETIALHSFKQHRAVFVTNPEKQEVSAKGIHLRTIEHSM